MTIFHMLLEFPVGTICGHIEIEDETAQQLRVVVHLKTKTTRGPNEPPYRPQITKIILTVYTQQKRV